MVVTTAALPMLRNFRILRMLWETCVPMWMISTCLQRPRKRGSVSICCTSSREEQLRASRWRKCGWHKSTAKQGRPEHRNCSVCCRGCCCSALREWIVYQVPFVARFEDFLKDCEQRVCKVSSQNQCRSKRIQQDTAAQGGQDRSDGAAGRNVSSSTGAILFPPTTHETGFSLAMLTVRSWRVLILLCVCRDAWFSVGRMRTI